MKNLHKSSKKVINLALQGGGSHGAFTWGVVDRLLEEEIQIEGLSGTSAGGMNAAAIAQGLIKGGNKGAQAELRRYWETLMQQNFANQFLEPNPLLDMFGTRQAVGQQFMELIQRSFVSMRKTFSPYDWNPININPLKTIVEEFYDFELLKSTDMVKLFLATTHIKSGKPKVFNLKDLSVDVLLASACLPTLFHAVEIEGEAYWDGGYIANPAIYPLIYECESPDILVVQLTPTSVNTIPRTAAEIENRHSQITYSACLLREMRMIHFMSELIDQGLFQQKKMKRVYMHMIEDNDLFADLSLETAGNLDTAFIESLFQAGRKAAEKFLKLHTDDLGKKTTADLEQYF